MSDDWTPVFSAATTWTELQAIIEDYAQRSVDDVRAQLEVDADVSSAQREVILARLLPLARARTRETFEAGWRRLQLDTAAECGDTVH